MAEYNDILIFGVRRTAQTGDTGFIVTPDEFGQMLGDAPERPFPLMLLTNHVRR